jgi:multidrug efflux system membrane fusion protein
MAQPEPPKSGRRQKLIPWIGGAGFLALVSVGVWFWQSHRQSQVDGVSAGFRTRMTTTVGIAVAKKGDIQIFLQGLGTVTPPATVTVKTQVSGQLVTVAFTEGQHVKKGDF